MGGIGILKDSPGPREGMQIAGLTGNCPIQEGEVETAVSPVLAAKSLLDPETHAAAMAVLVRMPKTQRRIVFNRLMAAMPCRRERWTDTVDVRNRLIREAFAADLPLALDRIALALDGIGYEISHLGACQHPIYGSCPWNLAGHASSHELPEEQKYRLVNLFIALDELIRSLQPADRRRLGGRWKCAEDCCAATRR